MFSEDPGHWQVIIRPNRSMTWRENLLFMAPLASLALTLAFGLALFGFWPILPFAGIEIGVVLWALYWVSKKGQRTERVVGDTDTVTVEKGYRYPESRREFPAVWARVSLVKAEHPWYPSKVLVGSHGQRVSLGDFLSDEEREGLADKLAEKIGWAQR